MLSSHNGRAGHNYVGRTYTNAIKLRRHIIDYTWHLTRYYNDSGVEITETTPDLIFLNYLSLIFFRKMTGWKLRLYWIRYNIVVLNRKPHCHLVTSHTYVPIITQTSFLFPTDALKKYKLVFLNTLYALILIIVVVRLVYSGASIPLTGESFL